MRIHFHCKAEIRRQSFADVSPGIAGVIAAIDAPVMLQKHSIRIRRVIDYFVNALSKFRILLVRRHEPRTNSLVARLPVLPAVLSPIHAASRDGYPHSILIRWIWKNRVQAKSAPA